MEALQFTLVPVVPLRNAMLLPDLTLPLRVGRDKSIRAIECADETALQFLTVSQIPGPELNTGEDPRPETLYRVGTLAKIEHRRGAHEHGYQILARGIRRCRVTQFVEQNGALFAQIEPVRDNDDLEPETKSALLKSIQKLAVEVLALLPAKTDALQETVRSIQDLNALIHLSLANLDLPIDRKQEVFENESLKSRALKVLELIQSLKNSLEVQAEVRERLGEKLGKTQREHILREQLRVIQDELSGSSGEGKSDDFRAKIEQASMSDEAKNIALEELKRLEAVGNASPESHVIRTYLETLCSLPWKKPVQSEIDLEKAREILDHDHFGLEKVKRRILQQLAVIKLKNSTRGSILLLVGPPGVGKTSLGESIARALGRKYVRASLGGVRDEAEIRGHRRTYVGAMPGRIIQAMKRVGTSDPVFILDEIDKLGRGWMGDPSNALLEVLDPEQNGSYLDHYLDVSFDLSNCFFIATANSLENIPAPLLDRMEVIELSGYTTNEKLRIALDHLWPEQLRDHGLLDSQVKIPEEALLHLIQFYTREAGVRDLSRKLAGVARVCAQRVATQQAGQTIQITTEDLEEALGPERFSQEVTQKSMPPGVVTGLAWTPQGGEILYVEAGKMPGTGKLTITGQLGDVMKESAQIALSLVRTHLNEVAPGTDFDKWDLHLHVPAGAIPKDGPSAGVTLMTAIASLFADRPVDPTLAMTGEVTLRGAVMPVGGIKEKVMAAHRAGVRRIMLCRKNEKDLKEVPAEVRSDLTFYFVEHAAEVLKWVLDLQVHGLTRLSSVPEKRSSEQGDLPGFGAQREQQGSL
jgi:ATP-dependent Lon protease